MMADILLEQSVLGGPGPGAYQLLARSQGFLEDWLPLGQQSVPASGNVQPAVGALPRSSRAHSATVMSSSSR